MYLFAGAGPDRWDCSGLTKGSYESVGVYIGTHSVTSQYNTMANANKLKPRSQMIPGDLLFYANGGTPGGGFYHVTMYVGNGQMIEAPREGIPVRVTAVRTFDLVPDVGRPTP
jgi:cell wall-associated NlpC family hydrolase